jgi:hypothetical protein
MTHNRFRNRVLAAAATPVLVVAFAHVARAVPVTAVYLEDPRCDPIPQQTLSHELGEVAFFPLNEAFIPNVSPANFTVCVPDDGIANDWIVDIINVSGTPWTNLFFVADLGLTVGNADGNMIDVVNAPGVVTDAFRIDSVGINPNLLGESQVADGIFAPGESWRFNVSNYFDPAGTAPAPRFRAPGVFAGSEPYPNAAGSTASIVAIPIPEPGCLAGAGIAAALFMRRRRGEC